MLGGKKIRSADVIMSQKRKNKSQTASGRVARSTSGTRYRVFLFGKKKKVFSFSFIFFSFTGFVVAVLGKMEAKQQWR